jgi:hypothetical protein
MHFHIMRHTGNLNGMYGNLNSHGCEWTYAQSRMFTSPLRVQTHAGRPVRSSSCMYGMAQQINMYTRWDEKSREEEEEGDRHGTPECIPAHTACPTQRCPCTTGDTLGPSPPVTPNYSLLNKDVLHTTTSPLRVRHASCSCTRLCFFLRSGQI